PPLHLPQYPLPHAHAGRAGVGSKEGQGALPPGPPLRAEPLEPVWFVEEGWANEVVDPPLSAHPSSTNEMDSKGSAFGGGRAAELLDGQSPWPSFLPTLARSCLRMGEAGMVDAVLGRLCAAVAAPALMAHVEEFAKRVKLSGTPEERESLAYVQARMDAFGYRTTLIEHDAYISLPGKGRVAVGGRDLTAITHS